jgi:asparagine synthase (glutamine-hydrolysing)
MREASRHVKVMIDGQGADEMMAGYVPYYLVNLRQLRRSGRRTRAGRELSRSMDVLWRLGRDRISDTVFGRSGLSVTSLLDPGFMAAHAGQQLEVINDDLKARLEDDLFRHSLQALLRYEDRNTMWFSVEGRVPFLSTGLLRSLWALDNTAILHNAWNKRVLREATEGILPTMVNQRRNKIGFTTPEDAWFTHMADYIERVFQGKSFGERPYFDQTAVLTAFELFRSGKANTETMTFWRILNVELWLQEFIDRDPQGTDAGAVPASQEERPAVAPTTAGKPRATAETSGD